jgi:hypothetical protein
MSMKVVQRATLCALACTLAACGGSSSGDSASTPDSSNTSTITSSGNSNGPAQVALSAAQYNVSPSTTAVLSIYRSGPASGAATATYATSNGTATAGADYTATNGTVTWSDGDASTKIVYVPVTNLAAGKQFSVALTSVSGQASFGSPSSATVAITGHSTVQDGSTGSTSSSSSSSSGGTGGTSASGSSTQSAQTAALLSYLQGLSADSKHVLAGQHTSYWDSNPLDYVNALKSQTGTQPAVLGTTLSASDIPRFGLNGSSENGVALSNQWLAAGGIVQLSLWPGNPQTMSGSQTDFDINCADVLTPGNATYNNWQGYLAAAVAKIKQINGPVILRPFVETNGRWFWWGNNCSASQQVQIWQQMWNYFAAAGVNNVLWEYNVNGGVGNYTASYPGSAYVDIVSFDSYPPTQADAAWYKPLAALGKPIILAESGPSPYPVGIDTFDIDNILQVVKANYPDIVGIVIWCQTQALSQQQGDEAFMTDPAIINLADITATL